MIARHWRGWTKPSDADNYESLLKEKVLPQLKQIPGYEGGYILRCDGDEESEFVVINLFNSLDAVRCFAGEDYAVPVFEPEARQLLSRLETTAMHYDVRATTTRMSLSELSPPELLALHAKVADELRTRGVP